MRKYIDVKVDHQGDPLNSIYCEEEQSIHI